MAKFCSECGATLIGSKKFCAECGAAVVALAESPPDFTETGLGAMPVPSPETQADDSIYQRDAGTRAVDPNDGLGQATDDQGEYGGPAAGVTDPGGAWGAVQLMMNMVNASGDYYEPSETVTAGDRYREVTGTAPPSESLLGSLPCVVPTEHPYAIDGSLRMSAGLTRGTGLRASGQRRRLFNRSQGLERSRLGAWSPIPAGGSGLAARLHRVADQLGVTIAQAEADEYALMGVWDSEDSGLIAQVLRFFADGSGREHCFWYVDALAYSADPGSHWSGPDEVCRQQGFRLTVSEQSMLAGLPQLLHRLFYVAEQPFPSTPLVTVPRVASEGLAVFEGVPAHLAPQPHLHYRYDAEPASPGSGSTGLSAGEPGGASWAESATAGGATTPVVAAVGYLLSQDLSENQLGQVVPVVADGLVTVVAALVQGERVRMQYAEDDQGVVSISGLDLQTDTQSLAGVIAQLEAIGASPNPPSHAAGRWVPNPGTAAGHDEPLSDYFGAAQEALKDLPELPLALPDEQMNDDTNATSSTNPVDELGGIEDPEELLGRLRSLAAAGNVDAMAGLGALMAQVAGMDAGIDWFKRAADAGHVESMTFLAGWYLDAGDNVAADLWIDRAARSGDPRAMTIKGIDARESGNVEEAEDWLLRAAEARDARAIHDLGHLYLRQGRSDEAESWLTKSTGTIENDEDRELAASAANSLAFSILIPAGRTDDARTVLQRAVDLEAGYQSVNALSNLGIVAFDRGNYSESRSLFDRVIRDEGPVDEARYYLGLIAEIGGDMTGARRLWTQAAAGDDEAYRERAAVALARLGGATAAGESGSHADSFGLRQSPRGGGGAPVPTTFEEPDTRPAEDGSPTNARKTRWWSRGGSGQ